MRIFHNQEPSQKKSSSCAIKPKEKKHRLEKTSHFGRISRVASGDSQNSQHSDQKLNAPFIRHCAIDTYLYTSVWYKQLRCNATLRAQRSSTFVRLFKIMHLHSAIFAIPKTFAGLRQSISTRQMNNACRRNLLWRGLLKCITTHARNIHSRRCNHLN